MDKKNLIGCLAAAVVLYSTTAWAMDARKGVLGINMLVGNNEPAGLVLDSADSFVNPAFATDYTNLFGLEGTAGAGDLYTGFIFADLEKIGMSGTLGIQVGRSFGMLKDDTLTTIGNINALNNQLTPYLSQINDTIDGDFLSNLQDVQSWGLLYALSMDGNLQAGVAVNYIGNSLKGKGIVGDPTSADLSKSISDLELRLGAKIGLGDDLSGAVDLGFNFPSYGFSYSSTALSQEASFSGFNLDLNLRLAYAMNKTLDAVMLAGYANYGGKTSVDADAAVTTDDVTLSLGRNDLYLGVGGLYHDQTSLAGMVLGFISQGYINESEFDDPAFNFKNNTSYILFPSLKILAEKTLAPWITLRGSIGYIYQGTSESNLVAGVSYTTNAKAESAIITAVGASVNFDSMVIESIISKNLLFRGPYIIGGLASGLNTTLSVGYKF